MRLHDGLLAGPQSCLCMGRHTRYASIAAVAACNGLAALSPCDLIMPAAALSSPCAMGALRNYGALRCWARGRHS